MVCTDESQKNRVNLGHLVPVKKIHYNTLVADWVNATIKRNGNGSLYISIYTMKFLASNSLHPMQFYFSFSHFNCEHAPFYGASKAESAYGEKTGPYRLNCRKTNIHTSNRGIQELFCHFPRMPVKAITNILHNSSAENQLADRLHAFCFPALGVDIANGRIKPASTKWKYTINVKIKRKRK